MTSLRNTSTASTSHAAALESIVTSRSRRASRPAAAVSRENQHKVWGWGKRERRATFTENAGLEIRERWHERREAREVLWSAILACACSFSLSGVAQAEETEGQLAGQIFENKCAGCHSAGGNVLAAGKTLKIEDLRKNDVATIESLYQRIYFGKAKMPGFGVNCQPAGQCTFAARLSDEQVSSLSAFVLQKAEEGWVDQ